jgi:hypothetical protein
MWKILNRGQDYSRPRICLFAVHDARRRDGFRASRCRPVLSGCGCLYTPEVIPEMKGEKMWLILKTELDYTKAGLTFAYAITVLFFIAAAYLEGWGIFGFMSSTTITYFITMAIIGSEADGEKRMRFLVILPTMRPQLAIVDWAYVTLVQFGMILFWISLLLFKPEEAAPRTYWGMFSQNGLVLSVITLFTIHTHLGFWGAKKYKRLTYGILLALALLLLGFTYFGHINAVAKLLWRHFFSVSGALVSTFLWLSLSYLSVAIFVRRKSYLG